MPPRRKRKEGGAFAKALLLGCSILLFLGLAEWAAWQFNPPPREGLPVAMFQADTKGGVWTMAPDFRGIMDNRVDFRNVPASSDETGARIVPAAPAEAPQRLLVIGDSQTFGLGLSDEESWPSRLQEDLNRRGQGVKAVNLAIPAINIDQYLARIRLLAPTLGANDTVLIGLSWNNLIAQPSDTESNRISEFTPRFQNLKPFLETMRQNSALVATLYSRAKAIYYRWRDHSPVTDLVKAGVPEANFQMMRQIAELIAPTGARLKVVLLPGRMFFEDGPYKVHSVNGRDFPSQDYQASLAMPLCEQAAISCINAFPLLHDHHPEGLVFPVDGHFNAKGAALIGSWLASELY